MQAPAQEQDGTVLFRSDQVMATLYSTARHPDLLVIFTGYYGAASEAARRDQAAFYARFDVDFVIVTPATRAWFQYPEMDALYAALRRLRPYRSIYSFGESMGGYEAIKSTPVLCPDRVLAIAPQFSVDPAKAGFDRMRSRIGAGLTFVADTHRLRPGTEYLVLVDRHCPEDDQHAQAFLGLNGNLRVHNLPYSTHHGVHMLIETLLLEPLIRTFLAGTFEILKLRPQIRARRTLSSTYMAALVVRIEADLARGRRRHAVLRQKLLRRIAESPATLPRLLQERGRALEKLGRLDAAIDAQKLAVAERPDLVSFHNRLGDLYSAAGDLAAALACHKHAVSLDPAHPQSHLALGRALMRLGQIAEAEPELLLAKQLGAEMQLPPVDPAALAKVRDAEPAPASAALRGRPGQDIRLPEPSRSPLSHGKQRERQ